MPIVRNFIRHASAEGLREYFTHKKIPLEDVDWTQDPDAVTQNVIQLVDHLDPDAKARLRIDAERIYHMADEIGQAALLEAVGDTTTFRSLESAVERSCWVYLHEPDNFRHAEDIRYADQYRFGRNWGGYQSEPGVTLSTDPVSIEAFQSQLREMFGLGDKVKIEFFERTLPDGEGEETEVIQVMIYQEGLPDSYLEFAGNDIVPRIRRPVSEHAVIYAPESGVIEVVASGRERRDTIARAFTRDLLKQPVEAEQVPLRRYNLQPLMSRPNLDTDPEDGIESVEVVMIKLKDTGGQGRLTLEVPARSDMNLYEYAEEFFGDRNPLKTGCFVPTQAKLSIRFHPENGAKRGKVLPVKISMPNGCDLRNRTEHEILIGSKYLKLWGLLEDTGE